MSTETKEQRYTTKGGLVIDERGHALDAETIAKRLNEWNELRTFAQCFLSECENHKINGWEVTDAIYVGNFEDDARALLARLQP